MKTNILIYLLAFICFLTKINTSNPACDEICNAASVARDKYCVNKNNDQDAFAWIDTCNKWNYNPDCWCKVWEVYPNGNEGCKVQNPICRGCGACLPY